MKIIISPAKKMITDTDTLPVLGRPVFRKEAEQLKNWMQTLTYEEAKSVWKCSDRLAEPIYERLREMDLNRSPTPAILAYEGIQYQYMAPSVMEQRMLDYLQEHLRILSGFYGLLRPFDGIVPYRLEMQAKFPEETAAKHGLPKDLYRFWGGKIAEELCREEDVIINLASKEYSKSIRPWLPEHVLFAEIIFGEVSDDGTIREKGTYAKMARGEMVNFMARRGITEPEELQTFDRLSFQYSEELSASDRYVFLRREKNAEKRKAGKVTR